MKHLSDLYIYIIIFLGGGARYISCLLNSLSEKGHILRQSQMCLIINKYAVL